jgi:hypothetical protein
MQSRGQPKLQAPRVFPCTVSKQHAHVRSLAPASPALRMTSFVPVFRSGNKAQKCDIHHRHPLPTKTCSENAQALLRLHPSQLTPCPLHRHDQHHRASRLPTQNPRLRRIHIKIQRHQPGVLRAPRGRPHSNPPRKRNEILAQRRKDSVDRIDQSQVERPKLRLVPTSPISTRPQNQLTASTTHTLSQLM